MLSELDHRCRYDLTLPNLPCLSSVTPGNYALDVVLDSSDDLIWTHEHLAYSASSSSCASPFEASTFIDLSTSLTNLTLLLGVGELITLFLFCGYHSESISLSDQESPDDFSVDFVRCFLTRN